VPNPVRSDPEINAMLGGGAVHGNGMTSHIGGAQGLVSDQTGTSATRWVGNNRGGRTSPDCDLSSERTSVNGTSLLIRRTAERRR